MTKVQILDLSGSKKSEMTTELFDSPIREDIVQKIVEVEKEKQPYAPFLWAGMQTSASGSVKHNRHVWKTDRGKGMSRFPKKRMSDKGDRFVWMGAVSPETKGGRRAHPPKVLRADLKINKKEKLFALKSALAMVASVEMIKKKYSSLQNSEVKIKLPIVVDEKIVSLKAKEFFNSLNKILGDNVFQIAVQKKVVRAGIGKMRNRRYKKNAGLLLVIGNQQEMKISGVDVLKVKEVALGDLAMNGARLVMFTESAIKDLEDKVSGKKQEKLEEKKIKGVKNHDTKL